MSRFSTMHALSRPAVWPLMTILLASMAAGAGRETGDSSPSAVSQAARYENQIGQLIQACRGARVALLTNPTGVTPDYRLTADLLHADADITLTAFFAPEHGLRGDRQAGAGVEDYVDPYTGVPVYSVYGSNRAPSDEQLKDIDILVFDIQDVGVRFYTYVWSMTYAMEAAAKNDVRFIVFDRPNPIGCDKVEGAPIPFDGGLVGRKWPNQPFGVATRHGMTAGEIARLVNGAWMKPKVELEVIPVPGYTRSTPFEETGAPWVYPSPNMPTCDTAAVYPGTCVFEGVNVSEGRGTTRPFELIGAPFIDGVALAVDMNALGLPGVRFRPAYFSPTFDDHAGKSCGGVQIHVTDRAAFQSVRTGLHLLKTIDTKYPDEVEIRSNASTLMGVANLHERIKTEEVDAIVQGWQSNLEAFKQLRAQYLLYPEASGRGGN